MTVHQHTVLIVEDEPLIRFLLSEALQDEGYAVLEASNVLEAVAILGRQETIEAVITDIDMPGGLNGLDLVAMVHRYDRGIAMMVTSGGRAMTPGQLPGNACFVPKPYRLDTVVSLLAAMMCGRSADRPVPVTLRQA